VVQPQEGNQVFSEEEGVRRAVVAACRQERIEHHDSAVVEPLLTCGLVVTDLHSFGRVWVRAQA
jgi:hypothetical protein